MASRMLPVVFVVATAVADASDLRRAGFYLLVAAVAAAAVAALWSIGELVEPEALGPADAATRLRALLAVLVLVAVLVAAAARGQAADTSTVPVLSATALVTCLALFALQALLALAAALPPGRARERQTSRF